MGESLIDKIKQKNKQQNVAPRSSSFGSLGSLDEVDEVTPDEEELRTTTISSQGEENNQEPMDTSPNNLVVEEVPPPTRKKSSSKKKKKSSNDSSSNEEITTAKPKLLTLEETIHQRIEQICYENPSVSRDTLIEALLIVAEQSTQLPHAIAIASDRLIQRKKSAVRRRTKTMSQKFLD